MSDACGANRGDADVTGGGVQGPIDSSRVPRFAGPATFARLPRADQVERVDVAVLGVPFDAGVSYRPGARFGPTAIREASRLLRPYNPAVRRGAFEARQVADCGDVVANPFDIADALAAIETAVHTHAAAGARVLVLGGDHTVALGVLRALRRVHGPIALVHFDAHLDTWDTYFGADYTHGTPFRRAREEGLLAERAMLHIGTRGPLYGAGDLVDDTGLGFEIVTSDDVGARGVDAVAEHIRGVIGAHPTYVSVDIDVLDPAHAPGTGTPEAGGLTSRELLNLLRALDGANLVAADVVEVSPAYDHAEITAIAASHVAYELVTTMTALPRPVPQPEGRDGG